MILFKKSIDVLQDLWEILIEISFFCSEISLTISNSTEPYSFAPNCRGGGGRDCKFSEKKPQAHLIIIKAL